MDKFKTFTGTLCAVDRANIDTDALIPKEHLKSIKRTGFGPALFSDWRYPFRHLQESALRVPQH